MWPFNYSISLLIYIILISFFIVAVFLDVAVFGDTNLELPSALSNRSAVEIHFDLKPSKSMDCNLVVELPLHARYPVSF
jgi:phosphatidylinositol glycan class X